MISLVTIVMNRSDRIVPCLSSWLKEPGITEAVLVDWSSTVPVFTDPSLAEVIQNPKTRVVRVSEETSFIAQAYSQNVGIQHATQPYICKVDIDHVLIDSGLMATLQKAAGTNTFYCGVDGKNYHHYGFAFFKRDDAIRIGGYNEGAAGYGFDDLDFYQRLKNAGVRQIGLNGIDKFVHHIPHATALSVENYAEKDKHKSNRANINLAKQRKVTPMSKYRTVVDSHKYTELVRIKG